jgi:hypothetical protein
MPGDILSSIGALRRICKSNVVVVVLALQPSVAPWPLFNFLILYTVSRTPCTRDQPIARPLLTHRTTQTQNKHTQDRHP